MRLSDYSQAPGDAGYSTRHSLKTWPKHSPLATVWQT
jgi:hypothetical protein